MTSENTSKLASSPLTKDDAEIFDMHDRVAVQLRHRIEDLLRQVDALRDATKSSDTLEDLVVRLREANQNLVIATIGAQNMQASAEAANRRQDEFLAMLAHELRNPLAPISMATALLEKILSSHPMLPKLHGIIRRQVNHMTHLVDDLLDASRISSGKIILKKKLFPLSDIIDSAVETSQPFINNRNQQLVIELGSSPVVVDGDHIRLAQVFSNLLINASKFSPEYERITVSARRLGNTVVVGVKDHGIGIEPDMQPHIFDLFTQGIRSLDRSQGGLGIGLSLVRTIIEMHDGDVQVSSAGTGFGSEFSVTLPVSDVALQQDTAASTETIPSARRQILIIEDNPDANETLKELLLMEGHSVACAYDGPSGLAMATENKFDVVICDIGLPGMDGYELVGRLFRDARTPMPCLIALTGYDQPESRTRGKEAGFDHYLVKPVAVDILLALIAEVPHSGGKIYL